MSHGWFGITAGILELIAAGVYVQSVVRGKTKPDRVTWWILALVSAMITASYYASGARETIWLPLAYAASFAVIAILSIFYGDGPLRLHKIDRISLLGALLSAVVWWGLKSPMPALFMNMVTEFIGLIPTMSKSYKRPWTEDSWAWILATTASLLNILAVVEWSFIIAAYPLYVFATNAVITGFVLAKGKKRS